MTMTGPSVIPAPLPAMVTEGVDPSFVARAYWEAVADLTARGRFGIRLGLGRIRAILRALGDPQEGLRGALVAGTNGKGSVIALAAAALQAAGYRVGATPKPHLVSYRERAVVDGRPIDPLSFARLAGEVIAVTDGISRRLGPPTEFEILTALIFRWFSQVGLDVALVEVGLGGRLDATHAWDGGVAVVTNVALDHTDRLGTTVTAIAREKAAIIVRSDVAVTGADGEALAVIRRRARRLAVPLTVVPPAPILDWDRNGLTVLLDGLGPTRIGLRGRHQGANAAVANALLDGLEVAGIARVSPEARRQGFAAARWSGRLELLDVAVDGRRVEVLLDGAHNPAGAAALARAVADLAPHLAGGRPTLLLAVMGDKDVAGILAALAATPELAAARLVATSVPGGRALPPARLAELWREVRPDGPPDTARLVGAGRGARPAGTIPPPLVEPDPMAALEVALAEAEGPVVVAGSLYLVGLVRARLVDDPLLRDPPAPEIGPARSGGGSAAAAGGGRGRGG
jgi:dihydrofolate synthase/folylpolyglutamate synthase